MLNGEKMVSASLESDTYLLGISKEKNKQAWIGFHPPFHKDIIDFLGSTNAEINKLFYHQYKVVWIYEQLFETDCLPEQKLILLQSIKLVEDSGKLIILVPKNANLNSSDIFEYINCLDYVFVSIEKIIKYTRNGSEILILDISYKIHNDSDTFRNDLTVGEHRKQAAIVVESQYRDKHFSIQSYFSSIAHLLSEKYDVVFVTYQNHQSYSCWYSVSDNNTDGLSETKTLNVDKNNDISYESILSKENCHTLYDYCYLGEDLDPNQYDLCVISNPWIASEMPAIKIKHKIGVVYDCIANTYSITNREDFIDWGYKHNAGYKYYNDSCDAIMGISKKSMDEYKIFYPNIKDKKIFFLPPIPPYQYWNVKVDEDIIKENAIILAAPLDKRKGLKIIPRLLNGLKEVLEKIYIFGMPRCARDDFDMFFEGLNLDVDIVYFPSITYSDLIDLYKKCKILLFPSYEEGLGFPIIESQICGCRVVTNDYSPMNELIVDGGYLLTGDYSIDISAISEMLIDDFSYDTLAIKASNRFVQNNLNKSRELLMLD